MSINLTPILLALAFQLNAQDFTQSPYQDFALASPLVADFNGDEKPDVLAIHYSPTPNVLVLQLNDGASPISFTEKDLNLTFDAVGQPFAVDFDGDQDMDICIAEGAGFQLYILENDGNANFTPLSLNVSGVYDLKMLDVDNDTDLDIVGINPDNNKLNLYLNDGAQHFSLVNILTTTENLVLFDMGDLDNDSDPDIVLGFDQFTGAQIVLYKNNGNHNFEKITLVSNDFSSIEGLEIDDINGDGKQDIVAIRSFECDAFLNQGSLSFMRKDLVNVGNPVRSLRTGDYNGDGRKDLMLGFNSADITWYKNLSNAMLTFESHVVGGVQPCFTILNGDLDNDGDEDVVVSNGEFWWYENNIVQVPSGTFDLSGKTIDVFPNPFTDVLQLKNLEPDVYEVKITDLPGRVVYASKSSSGNIDLSGLKSGVYLLSLTDRVTRQVSSTRIVKQ